MQRKSEADAGAAVTLTPMMRNASEGGVGWSQSALITIAGEKATAKFGGGGMSDVPTVLGTAVVPDGGTVAWHVKCEKKLRAGAPMRVGVQRTGIRCGMNWNDKKLKNQAWYLDSSGDMCNGPDTVFESGVEWGEGDVVGVRMDYRTLTFTINGKPLDGRIEGINGEVHCAAQLFSKGDQMSILDQYVPNLDEIDDEIGANSDPFANHKPNIQMPVKSDKPKGPAGTPDDPVRFHSKVPYHEPQSTGGGGEGDQPLPAQPSSSAPSYVDGLQDQDDYMDVSMDVPVALETMEAEKPIPDPPKRNTSPPSAKASASPSYPLGEIQMQVGLTPEASMDLGPDNEDKSPTPAASPPRDLPTSYETVDSVSPGGGEGGDVSENDPTSPKKREPSISQSPVAAESQANELQQAIFTTPMPSAGEDNAPPTPQSMHGGPHPNPPREGGGDESLKKGCCVIS